MVPRIVLQRLALKQVEIVLVCCCLLNFILTFRVVEILNLTANAGRDAIRSSVTVIMALELTLFERKDFSGMLSANRVAIVPRISEVSRLSSLLHACTLFGLSSNLKL